MVAGSAKRTQQCRISAAIGVARSYAGTIVLPEARGKKRTKKNE